MAQADFISALDLLLWFYGQAIIPDSLVVHQASTRYLF